MFEDIIVPMIRTEGSQNKAVQCHTAQLTWALLSGSLLEATETPHWAFGNFITYGNANSMQIFYIVGKKKRKKKAVSFKAYSDSPKCIVIATAKLS